MDELMEEILADQPEMEESPARPTYDRQDDVPMSVRQSLSLGEKRSGEEPESPADRPAVRPRTDDDALFAFNVLTEEAPVFCVEIPLEGKDFENFIKDPSGFANTAVNRKRVEISMRTASPKLKEYLRKAKAVEIQNWLANKVCEAVKASEIGDRVPIKVRWVLTVKGDGTAKARLVVLGFQDHRLGKMTTDAPTVSTRGRNMALQLIANKKLRLRKGDVKAAFLQGASTQKSDNVIIDPRPELREGLGLAPHDYVRLLKAVYRLCNTPREWYETVSGHGSPCFPSQCDGALCLDVLA